MNHQWVQYKLLTVHFFRRFFDNDLLTPGADPYATVVRALALLATPGMMIAMYLMPRYVELSYRSPQLLDTARRLDQMMFMTLSMSIIGFVSAFEWEALFPDRADFIILTPLPVRQRIAFAAKVTSLIGFLLLFTISINFMPALLFPLVAHQKNAIGPSTPIPFLLINAFTLLCASAFILLASMTIQGALLIGLPERWFRIASGFAQWILMGTMVTFLLLYPRATQLLRPGQTLTMLRWYPPAWFVALSDHWLRRSTGLSEDLAHRALSALGWSFLLAAILYVIAYRRHVGQSLESLSQESHSGRFREWIFSRLLTFHPIELGVSLFTYNTLLRSRAHKLIFEAYMGVAAALVVWELISLFARRSYEIALKPIPELLCIPLVLSFVLLSAMRAVFARPAELKANWLFRVSQNEQSAVGLDAAGKVMILIGIVPVTLPLLPVHAWLWGWPIACIHCAYCILLALLLRGALLMNFRNIPFTCTFSPAGPSGVVWGTSYFFFFTIYAYTMAKVEFWMFSQTRRMLGAFALLAAALAAVEWVRHGLAKEDRHTLFEDELEPEVRTLGLSQ